MTSVFVARGTPGGVHWQVITVTSFKILNAYSHPLEFSLAPMGPLSKQQDLLLEATPDCFSMLQRILQDEGLTSAGALHEWLSKLHSSLVLFPASVVPSLARHLLGLSRR